MSQAVAELYGGSSDDPFSSAQNTMSQESDSITEWNVRIRCKQFELGGSFSVLLFLRDVPDTPEAAEDLFTAPNFIGSFDLFVNEHPEQCSNCQNHADDLVSGFVHITNHVKKHYQDPLPDISNVEQFLTDNLRWRILKVGDIV